MFKYLALAVILTLAVVNIPDGVELPKAKPVVTTRSDVIKPWADPIAMVKYNDMIYHCQGVIKTDCGHSLHCGNLTVHCVTDFTIEYL